MSHKRIYRRDFLLASSGLYLAASQLQAQTIVHEVKIILSYDRGLWYYDPVGLYIEPGDTVRWQALRWEVLVEAAFTCVRCQRVEGDTALLVADHKMPHRGVAALFWDRQNLQCLCKHCHDSAKQREERRGLA